MGTSMTTHIEMRALVTKCFDPFDLSTIGNIQMENKNIKKIFLNMPMLAWKNSICMGKITE